MEELLDNVLVLVPVALIIFLRVFSEGARKRVAKAKKPAASTPSPVAAVKTSATHPDTQRGLMEEPREAGWKARISGPQTGHTRQRGTARPGLISRLQNYFSGSPDQQAERLEPLHFEEEAARRLGQFRSRSTTAPGTGTQMKQGSQVTQGYKEGLPGAMEESAAVTREPAARYSFPGRLERLTPLKRAIVLAEVLGKPKSLQ
jgi:hypothetical protein